MPPRRLPPDVMSLDRFMLRKQVLELYRDFMRLTRHVPEGDREYMRSFIRDDFKNQKHLTEELDIKMHLSRGRLGLREMTAAVHMPK